MPRAPGRPATPNPNIKKARRVSFVEPDSSSDSEPNTPPRPASRPSTPQPTTPQPQPSAQPNTSFRYPGQAVHTVQNTAEGLIINGVLEPRAASFNGPQPSHPYAYPHYAPAPPSANMSTVGAGMMPDPNAEHYQPPAPDTSNGPIQHVYIPRSDGYEPPLGVPDGSGGPPPAPMVYGPQYPGAYYQQAQPGMATAPIPIVSQGGHQTHYHPMPIHNQPGQVPMMAYGPAPGGGTPMAPQVMMGGPPGQPNVAYYMPGNQGPLPDPQPIPGTIFSYEYGRTKGDVESAQNAYANGAYERQGFKPESDDPARFYWTIQLDGSAVTMPRGTINSIPHRWFVTADGVFYARRLPD